MVRARLLEIAKPMPGALPPICGSVAANVGMPTDLTFEVDERAAAVAGVDRCAGLGSRRAGCFRSVRKTCRLKALDDAFGHARLKPERIAHGEHEVAHRQRT